MSAYHIKQGDCLQLMKALPDKSVNLTLTDIPYGEVNRESGTLRNLDKKNADIVTFDMDKLLDSLCRVTKESIYIFCGIEQVSSIRGGSGREV